MTDDELEGRLKTRYRARVGEDKSAPLTLRRDVAAIPQATPRPARWFGRGRGLTLLAAATLLLVGGAMAAGSGLVRLPSVVPPEPVPSLAVVASPSPAEGSPSPINSSSPAPSGTPVVVVPKPAIFAFNKGAGSSAECGNDGRGGCIPRMWVANLDGSGAHELLPDQSGCQRFQAWSPDGTRLLFTRSECRWNGEAGLIGLDRFYLTDANGSQPQLVDTGCVDLCVSENDAVFSADGLQILLVRTRSIPPAPSATNPVNGKPALPSEVRVLASIDLATGRVTELGDFDECPGGCESGPPRSDPIWSPDRTQILYTWKPQVFGPQPNAGSAVLVADADGRNVLQLSASGGVPAWSPDGTRIAFRSERYSWKGTWKPGVVQHPFFDIYTIRPDGTELVRLTSDEVSLNPEWSPDGRIWFIRPSGLNPDEPAQSWVMDADGSNAAQLSAAQLADKPAFQAWQVQPTP